VNHGDYTLAVAAMNGRPQRLITIEHSGRSFRDHINVDSNKSREKFIHSAAKKLAVSLEELLWLDDAITAEADRANASADARVGGDEEREEKKNQATQLVDLAGKVELFHDPDQEAYARFSVADHYEVAGLRTKQFRRWLCRLFYLAFGKAPSAQATQDAIGVLEGKAIFEGPSRSVHVRVAGLDGKIYVDLCNGNWQVIEITPTAWRLMDESPVMFRRAKAMLPLPVPVAGGSLNELRRFVQMTDEDWVLFLAWLVAAVRPVGPYPVLDLQGEHGSGKSTAGRFARALLDPNSAMLRGEPREPRDLMIAASNGWVLALDNLSGMQTWLSDCLCRLSTGGGFSTRTLYENNEETIFESQRPQIVNGIDDVATRPDLLDRCLILNLPRMEQSQRRPESELKADFEVARPRILGALFSAVVVALREVDRVRLPVLPRMADFAVWATAAEEGLGLRHGEFMTIYERNRNAGHEVALEASPVGRVLLDFITNQVEWHGTATQLLEEIDRRADDRMKHLKQWPKTAQLLGNALKRVAPTLRSLGVGVDFVRGGSRGRRIISLWLEQEQACEKPSEPSASSDCNKQSGPNAELQEVFASADDPDDILHGHSNVAAHHGDAYED
jgi:hypothetical protein